jgi:hypothetical protein
LVAAQSVLTLEILPNTMRFIFQTMNRLLSLMKKKSFTLKHYGLDLVSPTNQPNALKCSVQVDENSGWNFKVKISLLDGNKLVATGEASNHGFGTLIDSGGSIRRVFLLALNQLGHELERGGMHKQ